MPKLLRREGGSLAPLLSGRGGKGIIRSLSIEYCGVNVEHAEGSSNAGVVLNNLRPEKFRTCQGVNIDCMFVIKPNNPDHICQGTP